MNVFTYGSLMFPEVVEALTEGKFSYEDLILPGFQRRAIPGKIYPGVRENNESSVDGRLWFDLDIDSLHMLDLFEGSLYDRRDIKIKSESRGVVDAYIYIIPLHKENVLSAEPWDRKDFEHNHLHDYVARCHRFRVDNLNNLKRIEDV